MADKPDVGTTTGSKTPDTGTAYNDTSGQVATTTTTTTTTNSGSKSSSSGSGSSSSKKDAKEQQKKNQASYNNIGDIYQKASDTTNSTYQKQKNRLDTIYNARYKDIVSESQDQLNTITQQREANDSELAEIRRQNMQAVQWQPNQQKEQSTLAALRNRMGNAAYGSAIQDLAEGMQRVDDMNDVELINTWKQNDNSAYNNWYQADTSLIADYNDQITQIQDTLSNLRSDYRTDRSNIMKNLDTAISDLQLQYATTLNNANPLLATKKNLSKSAKNYETTQTSAYKKAAKALKAAKAAQERINEVYGSTSKTAKSSKAKAEAEAKANQEQNKWAKSHKKAATKMEKLVNKAQKQGKSDKEIAASVKKLAKAAVKKANKKLKKTGYKQISVGKGTDKYTMPDVKISNTTDMSGIGKTFKPTGDLAGLMKRQETASAVNPNTLGYIRPDASTAIGGTVNTSTAANNGFLDNLSPYRRV